MKPTSTRLERILDLDRIHVQPQDIVIIRPRHKLTSDEIMKLNIQLHQFAKKHDHRFTFMVMDADTDLSILRGEKKK